MHAFQKFVDTISHTLLREFRRTYNFGVLGNRNKLIRFWGQWSTLRPDQGSKIYFGPLCHHRTL